MHASQTQHCRVYLNRCISHKNTLMYYWPGHRGHCISAVSWNSQQSEHTNMHMCSKHVINIALKSSQICPGNKTSIKHACPVRDLFKKVNSVVFTLIRLVLSKRCIDIIYDGRLQSEGFIDCSKRVWLCLSIFCRTVEWRYSIWRKETILVVTHIVL